MGRNVNDLYVDKESNMECKIDNMRGFEEDIFFLDIIDSLTAEE